MPTYCTFEPGHGDAVLIVTNLTNGDVVSPCGACVAPFLATMVQSMGYTVTEPAGQDAPGDGDEPSGDPAEPAGAEPDAALGGSTGSPGPDGARDAAGGDSGPPDPAAAAAAHESMQKVTGGTP